MGDVKGDSSFSKGTVKRLTNRAKPTVSDAFRLQLQVLVTVLGGLHKISFRVRHTNRAKPTVSDAFRLQLQVLVTVLGGYLKYGG
jgi:hypothetical protein